MAQIAVPPLFFGTKSVFSKITESWCRTMKIGPNFKAGKESYYIPLSNMELQICHDASGRHSLWYHSEDLEDWLYAVFQCGGACEDGINIYVEHGKIFACMYESAPCIEVLDNRPFPAKDAPNEEWSAYHEYCYSEEGQKHFIGYADPFDTPEEELRIDVDLELSLYEAYLLLRAAFPTITPQELLKDVRALCIGGTIPRSEEIALNELLGWMKTAFTEWPQGCGGISYLMRRAAEEGASV